MCIFSIFLDRTSESFGRDSLQLALFAAPFVQAPQWRALLRGTGDRAPRGRARRRGRRRARRGPAALPDAAAPLGRARGDLRAAAGAESPGGRVAVKRRGSFFFGCPIYNLPSPLLDWTSRQDTQTEGSWFILLFFFGSFALTRVLLEPVVFPTALWRVRMGLWGVLRPEDRFPEASDPDTTCSRPVWDCQNCHPRKTTQNHHPTGRTGSPTGRVWVETTWYVDLLETAGG